MSPIEITTHIEKINNLVKKYCRDNKIVSTNHTIDVRHEFNNGITHAVLNFSVYDDPSTMHTK